MVLVICETTEPGSEALHLAEDEVLDHLAALLEFNSCPAPHDQLFKLFNTRACLIKFGSGPVEQYEKASTNATFYWPLLG